MSEALKLCKKSRFPRDLMKRFQDWKASSYAQNRSRYKAHAEHGQHPRFMAISCCDSRVHVTAMFGADPGEFFIHRNIAALVPPYDPNGGLLGTSSAIEYAVRSLNVAHILVLGHSECGGVQGCIEMCSDQSSRLRLDYPFVSRWLEILRPACERITDNTDPAALRTALEQEAVLVSLANLMTFPFVSDAVASGALTLHGLWHDIGEGSVWTYDSEIGGFSEL